MRVDVHRRIADLSIGELWELMWRTAVAPHWLGAGSTLPSSEHSRLVLADRAGTWRIGSVVRTRAARWEALLEPAPGWSPLDGVDTLTISVVAVPEGGAEVHIVEDGPYAELHRAEIERFWNAAVDRLQGILRRVADRRDSPRQAVVVIHGIGEQEPGRTLRALVASGVVAEADAMSFVKPDPVSGSFELRRVTFKATKGRTRPTTDVYELYWAHLIRDTTLGQVADWVRRILLRRGVPRPLRLLWFLVWAAVVAVLGIAAGQLFGLFDLPRWLAAGGVLAIVAGLLWRFVGRGVVINVLGDAARYLSPRPANVAHRQRIRQSGVDLLARLHEGGRYDRIVVLGHSLGSVIAYDVLTYAWITDHTVHHHPCSTDFKPLVEVERAIASERTAEAAQALQHDAWQQVRRNTQSWLVTDLVTVGSPLTYAAFLMASSTAEFRAAQADRVLPTCPPQTQLVGPFQRCSYDRPYRTGDESRAERTFMQLDHGAPFAVTRWTNLFFTVGRGGLTGDLVGGPVAPQFGTWVRDVPLRSPVRRFAHTWYWRPAATAHHLDALHEALGLAAGQELLRLAREVPAFVIAERVVAGGGP